MLFVSYVFQNRKFFVHEYTLACDLQQVHSALLTTTILKHSESPWIQLILPLFTIFLILSGALHPCRNTTHFQNIVMFLQCADYTILGTFTNTYLESMRNLKSQNINFPKYFTATTTGHLVSL